jgi:hypothetical protein
MGHRRRRSSPKWRGRPSASRGTGARGGGVDPGAAEARLLEPIHPQSSPSHRTASGATERPDDSATLTLLTAALLPQLPGSRLWRRCGDRGGDGRRYPACEPRPQARRRCAPGPYPRHAGRRHSFTRRRHCPVRDRTNSLDGRLFHVGGAGARPGDWRELAPPLRQSGRGPATSSLRKAGLESVRKERALSRPRRSGGRMNRPGRLTRSPSLRMTSGATEPAAERPAALRLLVHRKRARYLQVDWGGRAASRRP